jgi:hypothetical protein
VTKDCVLPFRLWISGALEAEGCLKYFGNSQQDGDSFSPALIVPQSRFSAGLLPGKSNLTYSGLGWGDNIWFSHALSLDAERVLSFLRGLVR